MQLPINKTRAKSQPRISANFPVAELAKYKERLKSPVRSVKTPSTTALPSPISFARTNDKQMPISSQPQLRPLSAFKRPNQRMKNSIPVNPTTFSLKTEVADISLDVEEFRKSLGLSKHIIIHLVGKKINRTFTIETQISPRSKEKRIYPC